VLSPTPERSNDPLDPSQLYRLMAWLSPSFPVGAFSYSSGLEWAVEAGDITDATTLQRWLDTVIAHGNGFCDGIFFVQAYRAVANKDEALLHSLAELAAAFTPSKERQLETTAQGQAFLQTIGAAWPCQAVERFARSWEGAVAYPIAVAVTAAGHSVQLEPALHAYLHAVAANLVSAGVRLIPLGQTDGQRLLAALMEIIHETCERALAATLEDLGSAAFRADLASMRHESQYTRLFRS
jgi:urease accessory protein